VPAAFDPLEILAVLGRHQVDFVVIGGFAAWLHGAPVVTADVDLVFDTSPDNVRRLVAALVAALWSPRIGSSSGRTSGRASGPDDADAKSAVFVP
jgi:hypothetical protein